MRPVYMIERDITEANQEASICLAKRDYAKYQQSLQRIVRLKDELEEAKADLKFELDNRNMDKAERSFFAKIINLSLNEADLSNYHMDMFFAYMKEREMVPVPEWERRARNFLKALKDLRDFVFLFFPSADLKDASCENFVVLHDIIRDKVFTDREKVYYNKYEEKAGGEG